MKKLFLPLSTALLLSCAAVQTVPEELPADTYQVLLQGTEQPTLVNLYLETPEKWSHEQDASSVTLLAPEQRMFISVSPLPVGAPAEYYTMGLCRALIAESFVELTHLTPDKACQFALPETGGSIYIAMQEVNAKYTTVVIAGLPSDFTAEEMYTITNVLENMKITE